MVSAKQNKPTEAIKATDRQKTRYVVNSYFVGKKTLLELIEKLAVKEAKELISNRTNSKQN